MQTTPVLASTWVDASTFRSLVHHLMSATRLPWRALALHLDIPERLMQRLATGLPRPLRRIQVGYARALLVASPEAISWIDHYPARPDVLAEYLNRLSGVGIDVAELATIIGCDIPQTRQFLAGNGQAPNRCLLLAKAAWSAQRSRSLATALVAA